MNWLITSRSATTSRGGEVEAALLISEHPEVDCLGYDIVNLRLIVGLRDTHENNKSRTDAAQDFTVDGDGGLRNSLNQRTQLSICLGRGGRGL